MAWPTDEPREQAINGSMSRRALNASGSDESGTGSGSDNAAPPAAGRTSASDPEKQKAAIDLLPSVSLPKGGGAIRGMGEKFSVTAATGAAGASVPLPFSPGRSGFTPALGLSYDSGGGNGPFGFGWSVGAAAITRKTDKGLPLYEDSAESDVYIFAGAEDLVPVLDASGTRKTVTRTVYERPYEIAYYRPRVEAGFSRIERWTDTDTGIIHWRTFSRDNQCALYGYDPDSVVADPHDPARIFSWKICRSSDDKGNLAVYTYIPEDDTGIDTACAHETNRTSTSRAAQTYLKTICYGNTQPYFPQWDAETESRIPGATDWMFKVVFDYGDHDTAAPNPTRDQLWPVRPDPFSTYRSGFEVRTYRRVQRVLFFNNFPNEPTAGADYLVRSVDLKYSDQQALADPRNPIYTMLVSAPRPATAKTHPAR